MKSQHGKIKGWMIGVISIAAILVVFIGTIAVSYISAHNYGAKAENTIVSEYENMENILGQYSLKISEAAQVPTMQKNDLRDVFSGAIQARYGKSGSQASMQWIKEQNPSLDQGTYKKLQQMIEAGRNKFENAQTKFIDTKRVYKTSLDYFWKGMWMKVAGFPKIDLSKYAIVSSTHAKETFKTGIDTGLKLR